MIKNFEHLFPHHNPANTTPTTLWTTESSSFTLSLWDYPWSIPSFEPNLLCLTIPRLSCFISNANNQLLPSLSICHTCVCPNAKAVASAPLPATVASSISLIARRVYMAWLYSGSETTYERAWYTLKYPMEQSLTTLWSTESYDHTNKVIQRKTHTHWLGLSDVALNKG